MTSGTEVALRVTANRPIARRRHEPRPESSRAPRGDSLPPCYDAAAEEKPREMGLKQGELDLVIKARLAFFAAERALVKASADYEKARTEYERACAQLGLGFSPK